MLILTNNNKHNNLRNLQALLQAVDGVLQVLDAMPHGLQDNLISIQITLFNIINL